MSKNNRLGLNLFEVNLKRHPSVKGLFDEDGKMKISNESKDELLLLSTDNKSSGKESNDSSNNNQEEQIDEKETEDKNNKITFVPVQIKRVEEKMVDNKETYYTEMNIEERKQIIENNKTNNKNFNKSKPLSYKFDDNQKKFDQNITEAMSKGKNYSYIEDKFEEKLKKK